MVRHLEIRHHRLSVFLDFHILAVIFSDGNGRVDDVGNHHHNLRDFFLQLGFQFFQLCQTPGVSRHLGFFLLRLFFLALGHQGTDFLGYLILGGAQRISFLLCLSALRVQRDHFIHQCQFFLLELLSDILFYDIRVLP